MSNRAEKTKRIRPSQPLALGAIASMDEKTLTYVVEKMEAARLAEAAEQAERIAARRIPQTEVA